MLHASHAPRPTALAQWLSIALVLPASGTALAQDAAPSDEASELETIVVVGSRIKRSAVEGAAAISIIRREQLEAEGFRTAYEAIQSLSQNTGFAQNENFQTGFTVNAQVVNLRGMGPGRVLTLVNGRRVADYPLPYNGQSNFANLGAIPLAAIERIEVLSGGASAIYGSDAVAGVINVVLRSGIEGNAMKLSWGKPTEGGGHQVAAELAGGTTRGPLALTWALSYNDRGAIHGTDRDFMDSTRDNPSTANPLPFETLALVDRATGARLFPDGADASCARFDEFTRFTQANGQAACGSEAYFAQQAVRNANESLSAYLAGDLAFDNGLSAFATVSAWDSSATAVSAQAAMPTWQSVAFYDANLQREVVARRTFTLAEVGGRDARAQHFDERATELTFGLRGSLGYRFDWEAALSRSDYRVEIERPRFLAAPLNAHFLGPQLGTATDGVRVLPVYAIDTDRLFNPVAADVIAALTTPVRTEADSQSTTASLSLTGELFELPHGAVGLATILEATAQDYTLAPDARILPGASVIDGLTGTAGGGERDRYALGAELRVPVTATLTASLAGRYDKYDDATSVDDAFSMTAGLELRPVDGLLLRGTYATSFRAPDMHYVFADESGYFATVLDELACRQAGLDPTAGGACVGNPTYAYSVFGTRTGSTGLEEEKGRSWSLGAFWDVTDALSVSADFYRIELEGAVADIASGYTLREEAACRLGTRRDGSAVDPASAACAFFTSLVTRDGTGRITDLRSFPINQAFLAYEGVDVSMNYRIDAGDLGAFRVSGTWTHVLGQERELFPGDGLDQDFRDDRLANGDARSRARASVTWDYGPFSTTLTGLRTGTLPNYNGVGRSASHEVLNASVRWAARDDLDVSLVVDNATNRQPSSDPSYADYPYFNRTYSAVGREVFVQLDYRF